MTDQTAERPYLDWLEQDCGYLHVRLLPDGRWSGVMRLLFTGAIIVGRVGDVVGYSDRWCYDSIASAGCALAAWDGVGEPTGWHRHPATGRRVREDGTMEIYS